MIWNLARLTYERRQLRVAAALGRAGKEWNELSDVSKLAEYRNVEDMVMVLRSGGWIILNTQLPPLLPTKTEAVH